MATKLPIGWDTSRRVGFGRHRSCGLGPTLS